jgi:glucokinase
MSGRAKIKRQLVTVVEAEILRRVRGGGRSRVELARALRVAPSTASIYVDRLVKKGLLLEKVTGFRKTAGRSPTLLHPHPDGGRFIGVDFEAHNIMAIAVDFSQQPLRRLHRTIPAGESVDRILMLIERSIARLIAADPRPVLGIGVGVPGPVDPLGQVAVHYPFIAGWRDVPLGSRLSSRFRVPVFLENNIRSMALAELWFGAGHGLHDFVCVGVRSGIAAGVISDGRLLRGADNRAGEIGRWICPPPSVAGLKGLLRGSAGDLPETAFECVASLSALVAAAERAVREGRKTSLRPVRGELTIDRVLSAARGGDELAASLLRAAAGVHGWAAHQLHDLLNPQRIIFAGKLAELGELFLGPVRQAARQFGGLPEDLIVASSLGAYNGALGAAALALHQWKPRG